MKPTMLKNRMNSDVFVCDDIRVTETIDGVEYIVVHRLNEHRMFKMRRDALEKINTPVTQRIKSTTLRT
jgi:predicted small metal-binding protein